MKCVLVSVKSVFLEFSLFFFFNICKLSASIMALF